MKECKECGVEKSLEEFNKKKTSKDGKNYICKICEAIKSKEYRDNPDNRLTERDRDLKKKYGITLYTYTTMLESQGGVCDICGKSVIENGKALAVDHNHNTGAVRGLLCNTCNSGIGLLQDNTEILQLAINYLNKHKEE